MTKNGRKTVGLLRCSTTKQDTAHQRRAIEEWAKLRGESIDAWREEDGVSGASRKRPVLEQLVRDATRGRVGVVVVFELERLGRSMPRIVNTIHELGEAGADVVDVRRGIDTRTGMGKAMLYVAGVFAEIERDAIRARVKSGIEAARAKGTRLGRPRLVFTEEELAELRGLIDGGESLREVSRAGEFKVFDTKGVARSPSVAAMSRALRGL